MAPTSTVEIREPPRPRYVRRPGDVLRLLIAVVLLVLGTAGALLLQDEVLTFEGDVISVSSGDAHHKPHSTPRVVRDVTAMIAGGIFLGLLVYRRFRIALYFLAAYLVAAAGTAWAIGVLEHFEPPSFALAHKHLPWTQRLNFSGVGYLASVTAMITVLVATANHRWRRLAWLALVAAVLARVIFASLLPATAAFEITFGWLVGIAILLAFKAPNPKPKGTDVAAAMAHAGYPLSSLHFAAVDARGSTPYFAVTTAGQHVFVKVLGTAERSADFLFRLYRQIRFRDIGDQAPMLSVRQEVEHEALLTLAARDAGVRTPRPLTLTDVEARGPATLLASERLVGHSLDSVDPAVLDDQMLRQLWEQVKILRSRRMAHRDLRLANMFLDDAGQAWIIDFGFSEVAAEDYVLGDDVVGLLASTALEVGPQRAVAAAAAVLGKQALADALPRMQPDALSAATRKAIEKRKPLLNDLRKETQEAAGVEEVKFEHLQRIRLRTVLMLLMLGGAVWFLYPQLVDAGDVWERIKRLEPAWALAAAAASFVTYVGATFSMMGAVPRRLRPWRTFVAQLASSFTNRITPAQAGGYAVNIRFLQKSGVETPVAITGVGLNTVGGLIVHLFLLAVFLVWTGSSGLSAIELPDVKVFGYITLGVVVGLVVFFALPVGRRLLRTHVWPTLRRGAAGLVATARQPRKLVMLLGGSLIVTLSYILALTASVQAFGGGVSFPKVAVAYLTASAVASAAPTPGGLGAAEAAYAIGLGLVGLNQAEAISAVFLFRTCTFWLPILPGWLAYRSLRTHGEL